MDSFQQIYVLPVLGIPELKAAFHVHVFGSCPVYHPQHPQVLSRAVLDRFMPQPGLIPGVAPARCSTLHLVLLNAMRFSWVHFLNLSTSF